MERPDAWNWAIPLSRRSANCVILQFTRSQTIKKAMFDEPARLNGFLNLMSMEATEDSVCNIYIVQNINSEVVSALGHHLQVPPLVFMSHERTSWWSRQHDNANHAPELPSLTNPEQAFQLNYYEVLYLLRDIQDFRVSCAQSGRYIHRTKLKGQFIQGVIVNRKCSF